eukprot:PhM_4_TR16083/c0_g1_i1/m.38302
MGAGSSKGTTQLKSVETKTKPKTTTAPFVLDSAKTKASKITNNNNNNSSKKKQLSFYHHNQENRTSIVSENQSVGNADCNKHSCRDNKHRILIPPSTTNNNSNNSSRVFDFEQVLFVVPTSEVSVSSTTTTQNDRRVVLFEKPLLLQDKQHVGSSRHDLSSGDFMLQQYLDAKGAKKEN